VNLLECRDLSCRYDSNEVLRNVSLTVGAGECVALLGPNGTGKSTLLKACTKTLAYRGSISLQGGEVSELAHFEIARRAAFVPQEEPTPFPFLVRDMVAMGRLTRSKGLFDSKEDSEAAIEAMRFADCIHLAERPVTELSGGERQRVLIARAIAQDCPLMLLDEPTSHLDISHQIALATLIQSLIGRAIGIVVALHDLNLAARMATRGILLSEGRIVKDAPLRDVLESDALDEVYGVVFRRIAVEGSLMLAPA
jgi:iron complex transport system ATP-binding protein